MHARTGRRFAATTKGEGTLKRRKRTMVVVDELQVQRLRLPSRATTSSLKHARSVSHVFKRQAHTASAQSTTVQIAMEM
jgi:hypothetical protein